MIHYNMFLDEMEQEAIGRIQKFAKISELMGYDVSVGFSGGKDSLVVYDLCKRAGIDCRFFFNHSLEDLKTLQYIRNNFPDVTWRRTEKGFFEYLIKNKGFLPTPQIAWCCETYKHNPKFVDDAAVLGVRAAESAKRKGRKVFESKNKTFAKKNKAKFDEFFEDRCQGVGATSKIGLRPIVDWTDEDVWDYIRKYDLHYNPLYDEGFKRVGCMICPKANFTSNYGMLMRYPKLVDCAIRAMERGEVNYSYDWSIKSENMDYADDKVYYICRWLNHGFMPFTKKQQKLYEQFRQHYDIIKNKKL